MLWVKWFWIKQPGLGPLIDSVPLHEGVISTGVALFISGKQQCYLKQTVCMAVGCDKIWFQSMCTVINHFSMRSLLEDFYRKMYTLSKGQYRCWCNKMKMPDTLDVSGTARIRHECEIFFFWLILCFKDGGWK